MSFCLNCTPAERKSLRCLVILWNTRKYLTQAHCLSVAPRKWFVCMCECPLGKRKTHEPFQEFWFNEFQPSFWCFFRALASSLMPKESAWNCNNGVFVLVSLSRGTSRPDERVFPNSLCSCLWFLLMLVDCQSTKALIYSGFVPILRAVCSRSILPFLSFFFLSVLTVSILLIMHGAWAHRALANSHPSVFLADCPQMDLLNPMCLRKTCVWITVSTVALLPPAHPLPVGRHCQ